ncbi:MAG: thymidylate synthase [Clostridiales bacterium]|nr:thymidylate synthase [Clostridiales bacterium]
MKELFVEGKSLPDAYHKAIAALHLHGDIVSSKDWNQMQKEASMTFVAEEPLKEPMVSKLYIGGFRELQQYVMEILDGILDFKIGDGWDYTYHDRMARFPLTASRAAKEKSQVIDQIEFVIRELQRQPDSRRAVISVRDNSADPFSADPACLQHLQFFLREGKLHCKVLLRSNDAAKASFMNAFAFIMLQKKIADNLAVDVGTYTHRANSFHVYERDFSLLEQYAGAIETRPAEEITYAYEGFYDELMEESIPAITSIVEGLRNKT